MTTTHELIGLLRQISADAAQRKENIKRFQQHVWADKDLDPDPEKSGVLRDLAYDLDFFRADPAALKSEPTFFGEERLKSEIESALRKLE